MRSVAARLKLDKMPASGKSGEHDAWMSSGGGASFSGAAAALSPFFFLPASLSGFSGAGGASAFKAAIASLALALSLALPFALDGLEAVAATFSGFSSVMCVPVCAASADTVPCCFGQSRGNLWSSSQPSTSMSCAPALASRPWNFRWSSVEMLGESKAWRMVTSTSAVRKTWRWCAGRPWRIRHWRLSSGVAICQSWRCLMVATSFQSVARVSPGCGGISLPTGIISFGKTPFTALRATAWCPSAWQAHFTVGPNSSPGMCDNRCLVTDSSMCEARSGSLPVWS
mmetsp:Transcript_47697/g.123118  ORF Transcript_47697/g.123118 Transcript_47697/m.123118 type:complete len:285 (+) Transcript_47697:803-1657(+)